MVLTVDKLINDDRFCGENVLQFLLYTPLGILLLACRTVLALVLWIASIVLPKKPAVNQMLSTLACWTFGVYVKMKGTKDPRCNVMVANYVSCLDSLAVSHVLGTISLRKWKVPPFFASTLGIRNAAQFVKKQEFAECGRLAVLLQPEGGPTNGRGLLRFTDWPLPLPSRLQPLVITVERPFTKVTVHRPGDARDKFPWSDALWFLWTPVTMYTVRLLPSVERQEDDDGAYVQRIRQSIADALGVEQTSFKWEELNAGLPSPRPARAPAAPSPAPPGPAADRLARQVREVLPNVPMRDILKDLAVTRSVDVTITNFLEGVTPYTPEEDPAPGPSSQPVSQPQPRYVTPAPTGVFPKDAKLREMSFQERKARMIAEARKRYMDKHGLNLALNNC